MKRETEILLIHKKVDIRWIQRETLVFFLYDFSLCLLFHVKITFLVKKRQQEFKAHTTHQTEIASRES